MVKLKCLTLAHAVHKCLIQFSSNHADIQYKAMNLSILIKLLAVAAIAVTSGLHGAEGGASKAADKAPVKSSAPASGEVKKDMDKFNAQRDAMLSERQALINQLKSATDEQRKTILEKMKEIGEAQRELSKQIRDDLRKLRQSQGSPGRG